ncbi:MAG TPA: thioesterase family protein [Spongiibacteraceae bacterium]|jgi:acyl-CoA thioester hydrolase|nr:thioesterase family protein [Spongiibacteraceae bacterium]HUH38225.1 thioesterase family protein [Spongiibacteraceae bacterium]
MTPEAPLLFETRLTTRWGEQDLFAHINNVHYLRYFEEGRVRWLASLGLPISGPGGGSGLGEGPIVARVAVDYLMPVRYPAELLLRLYLGRMGTRSLTLLHTLAQVETPDQVCARGEVVLVWYDHDRGESRPLPAQLSALASRR